MIPILWTVTDFETLELFFWVIGLLTALAGSVAVVIKEWRSDSGADKEAAARLNANDLEHKDFHYRLLRLEEAEDHGDAIRELLGRVEELERKKTQTARRGAAK